MEFIRDHHYETSVKTLWVLRISFFGEYRALVEIAMFDARIGFKSWSLFTTMTFLPNFKQPDIYILCRGGGLFVQGVLCPGGGGSLSRGVSVRGRGSLSDRGVSVQGVSVRGEGVSLQEGLCPRGISVWGRICPGSPPLWTEWKTGEKNITLP